MTNGSELKSPVAQKLRRMGYRPLPRMWVLEDELSAIVRVAEKHSDVVNEVRARHRGKDTTA